jgi:ABC-type spermidine/putrescine transport system permease subunit I
MVATPTAGIAASTPRLRRWNWPLLALLPIVVIDFVLFVLPMLVIAAASVLVIREFHVTFELTTNNYRFFLGNPLYLSILLRTLAIAAIVTFVCVLISYPFAYLLTRLPKGAQRLLLVLVILPFWTSYLLRVYAWMTILGERGLLNRAFVGIGLIDEPFRFLLYSDYAIVIVSVYLYIPYCILALYTAIERVDPGLLLAARDLGAPPWRAFVHVMLPLTMPGVFASFIFVFIPMIGEYVTPSLVGGARGLMIVNVIVSQFQALRFGIGSAMVFVLAGLALALVLLLRRVARLEKVFGV